MLLQSREYKLTQKYSGKSKFDFWKRLEIGNVIQVSLFLEHTGYGSNGIYVPSVKIVNLSTKDEFETSFNEAIRYLNKLNIQD